MEWQALCQGSKMLPTTRAGEGVGPPVPVFLLFFLALAPPLDPAPAWPEEQPSILRAGSTQC